MSSLSCPTVLAGSYISMLLSEHLLLPICADHKREIGHHHPVSTIFMSGLGCLFLVSPTFLNFYTLQICHKSLKSAALYGLI